MNPLLFEPRKKTSTFVPPFQGNNEDPSAVAPSGHRLDLSNSNEM